MPRVPSPSTSNPFRFGALALDDDFADRKAELAELKADALAGQDVVLFAPRRFGKSSLVWRVSQELLKKKALVAYVDLMTTPTLGRLADKLAQSIHEDVASPLFRARERLRVFQGLRVTPTVTVDPIDGSLSFSFSAAAGTAEITATIERLLELPGQLAGERDRPVVLVLDEFQEVVDIDDALPRLMRSVFQRQPEVSHIYLGSKRHTLEQLFNDQNEPFWRSAKRTELGVIDPVLFAPFILDRFANTAKAIDQEALDLVLATTAGHPYATQELCYFLWQRCAAKATATPEDVQAALADVLRSEDAHFTVIWERASSQQRVLLQALAAQEGHPLSGEYRRRHALPSVSSIQRALQSLERSELVGRDGGRAWIAEPFLAPWLRWKTR
jgi:AAA+ ATPase superfamily predicted ATPase